MFGLEDIYWWFIARRQLALELLQRELKGRADARILDVGCGTGSNLHAFATLGRVYGIDASSEALLFCDRENGSFVAPGALLADETDER